MRLGLVLCAGMRLQRCAGLRESQAVWPPLVSFAVLGRASGQGAQEYVKLEFLLGEVGMFKTYSASV